MDRRIFLKVKAASLAEEARIIRRLEKRRYKDGAKHPLQASLTAHRREAIRPEVRATQLAYAFLRGKTYDSLEPTSLNMPQWGAVARLVREYGVIEPMFREEQRSQFDTWMTQAKWSILDRLMKATNRTIIRKAAYHTFWDVTDNRLNKRQEFQDAHPRRPAAQR